jgi:hypothetical protein
LELPSGSLQLTFTGTRRCVRQLPVGLVAGRQWVSDQLPEAGNFDSIVGLQPIVGTVVSKMVGGAWLSYTNTVTGWRDYNGNPVAPTAAIGEAWSIYAPCDSSPPPITCTNLVMRPDPGQCSKSNVTYQLGAPSCLGNPVTFVCSPTNGSIFPVGKTSVTCWGTDAWGNSNSCSFTVTVQDLWIDRGTNRGESLVSWPVCLTQWRLQYADTFRFGFSSNVWWDFDNVWYEVAGASSTNYLDRFSPPTGYAAAFTCDQAVPTNGLVCSPLLGWPDNGKAFCHLEETNLTVRLNFASCRYNWTNSSIRLYGPAPRGMTNNVLYDLPCVPGPQVTNCWYPMTCQGRRI